MDKDVPEATDLLPRDGGVTQLEVIGQALSCFGQGLQISQGCVVEDFVSANVAARAYEPDLGYRVENVERVGLPRFTQRSTASCKT